MTVAGLEPIEENDSRETDTWTTTGWKRQTWMRRQKSQERIEARLGSVGKQNSMIQIGEVGHFSRNLSKEENDSSSTPVKRKCPCPSSHSGDLWHSEARTSYGPSVDMTGNDVLSTHEEKSSFGTSAGGECPRIVKIQKEEEHPGDEVLGVCHRFLSQRRAKTLSGRRALARHEALTNARRRWWPDVAPVKIKGFDDSTQQSDGTVELHWRVGRKLTHFVAHVRRNSGLLLSRPDLKARFATTRAGDHGVDLLDIQEKRSSHPPTVALCARLPTGS